MRWKTVEKDKIERCFSVFDAKGFQTTRILVVNFFLLLTDVKYCNNYYDCEFFCCFSASGQCILEDVLVAEKSCKREFLQAMDKHECLSFQAALIWNA